MISASLSPSNARWAVSAFYQDLARIIDVYSLVVALPTGTMVPFWGTSCAI